MNDCIVDRWKIWPHAKVLLYVTCLIRLRRYNELLQLLYKPTGSILIVLIFRNIHSIEMYVIKNLSMSCPHKILIFNIFVESDCLGSIFRALYNFLYKCMMINCSSIMYPLPGRFHSHNGTGKRVIFFAYNLFRKTGSKFSLLYVSSIKVYYTSITVW